MYQNLVHACRQFCGFGLKVGNPTSLHTKVGLGPGCGPGAGLVRAWRGPGAGLVLGTGLQLQSCCGRRIAPPIPALTAGLPRCTTSSSGLELFLPEHSLAMEPGFRHVVYAQNEGQAACEERVLSGRLVMPPPPRAIVVHAADVGRIGIYGLSGCLAGQSA